MTRMSAVDTDTQGISGVDLDSIGANGCIRTPPLVGQGCFFGQELTVLERLYLVSPSIKLFDGFSELFERIECFWVNHISLNH